MSASQLEAGAANDEDLSLTVPEVAPPSVQTDAPCVASYTYFSVDAPSASPASQGSSSSAKGKQKAEEHAEEEAPKARVEGNWMLGVDEAGRGPVLGAWREAFSCRAGRSGSDATEVAE